MEVNVLVAEGELQVGIAEFIAEIGSPFRLVGAAANGLEALQQLESCKPHILLTDIRMPLKDGFELIEEVTGSFQDIRIIILSGYDDFHYARRAMRYGVHDYILKPLHKEELVAALYAVTNSLYDSMMRFKESIINQEKWDMELIGIESQMFDDIELGDMKGAEASAYRLLAAIEERVGRNGCGLSRF